MIKRCLPAYESKIADEIADGAGGT